MKKTPIFIFIISLFLGTSFVGFSQNRYGPKTENDTVYYQERYGLRIGVDLSKPVRSLLDDNYSGWEFKADYRVGERLYPAVELGHEDYAFEENNFWAESKGNYIKIGVDYNVYKNWIGMQNEIYVGLRYGYSGFSQTLDSLTINNRDHYFPQDQRYPGKKFKDLSAQWIGLQLGLKVEVIHNVYLSLHAELKHLISEESPANFTTLYIPGFNRRYQSSQFGMGWGYSISYLIPITKKLRKEKR